MKATAGFLIRTAMLCLTWFVLTGPPALAQQQQSETSSQPPYTRLETQSTTYTWLAAAAMLAGTMVIAFKKPKRAASR